MEGSNTWQDRQRCEAKQHPGGMHKAVDHLLVTSITFHLIITFRPVFWLQGYMLLTFKNQGKNDHPGFDLVDHVGILQIGVTTVDILYPLADL